MQKKRKFGLLTVFIGIAVIAILLCTKTTLLAKTRFYVDGAKNEKIKNTLEAIESGQKLLIIERTSFDEFNHIVDVVYDSPKLFWLDMKYHALSLGDISVLVLGEKYRNIDEKQAEIDRVVDDMISSRIHPDMSEYEKVLAVHDWLCENIHYGESINDSDQDIYGALVLKEARCAGYAKSFAYILEKIGIEAYVVSGDSFDESGNSVAHAWNLIYINNEPYYFDVTWDDDAIRGATYAWFGLTTDEFKRSHFPGVGYEWVSATATSANYYVRNGYCIDDYNYSVIVKAVNTQGYDFTLKCDDKDTLEDLILALESQEEMQKVMQALGIRYLDKIRFETFANSTCVQIEFVQ